MRYKVYGSVLKSDIVFSQLPEDFSDDPEDFEILTTEIPDAVKQHIREHKGPSGRGDGFVWVNTPGGYFCILDGKKIVTEEKNEGNLAKMRTYLLGYGLALLFYDRGEMAVHCSAVEKDGNGILLAGGSGAGKSTLAEVFLDRGWKLVADDVAVVKLKDRHPVTDPAFPVRKLCRDAALMYGYDLSRLAYIDEEKDKFAVACPEVFADGQARIKAMFVLTPCGEEKVRAEEVTGQEKIQLFTDHLFLHIILKTEGIAPDKFFRCLEILSELPVFRIYRPLSGGMCAEEMADLAVKQIL
ncbi:MAG: hypothetical protein J5898_06265 [Lachnospiraceae bacterium]|nr:hypothetical protein [Lachnospiraceae bacterium]